MKRDNARRQYLVCGIYLLGSLKKKTQKMVSLLQLICTNLIKVKVSLFKRWGLFEDKLLTGNFFSAVLFIFEDFDKYYQQIHHHPQCILSARGIRPTNKFIIILNVFKRYRMLSFEDFFLFEYDKHYQQIHPHPQCI